MKKTFIPLVLVIAVGLGVYFLFFYDSGESDPQKDQVENADSNGTDSTDLDNDEPSPLELEREQRLNERARPQEFVALNYTDRRNLLGEVVIEGSLTNNSELTMYKDFQLMIYFRDSEGMMTDSASQVVFEQLTPGETAPFKLKEKAPRKADILVQISDAKAEDIPKELKNVEN